MSIEENTNNTTSSSPAEETVQPTQTAASSVGAAASTVSNVLTTFLDLKDSNPKVFFGIIGGVVVLLIALFSMGGSDPKLPVHQNKPVVIGQSYILKGANAYDAQATIRLVAVPGSMAAYDDTEEADREGGCKHIPSGTPVKVTQAQDAFGKKDLFVEVEMNSGECAGTRGWALAVNLQ